MIRFEFQLKETEPGYVEVLSHFGLEDEVVAKATKLEVFRAEQLRAVFRAAIASLGPVDTAYAQTEEEVHFKHNINKDVREAGE